MKKNIFSILKTNRYFLILEWVDKLLVVKERINEILRARMKNILKLATFWQQKISKPE